MVVAAWLGATMLARAPRRAGSGLFALLSLTVAVWSGAWIVRRLSSVQEVSSLAGSITAMAGSLLPALLAHLVLVLAVGRPWSRLQRGVLVLAYLVAISFGGLSAVARENRAFGPNVTVLGVPGLAIDWTWIAFRIGLLGLAAWWIWAEQAGHGRERPRPQLVPLLGAVLFGAMGGTATIVLDQLGGPSWPGTTLLAIGFVFAAYSTFRSDLFFAPDTARRILSYSLSGALLVAVVAAGASTIDTAMRRSLGLDNPLPIAILLVLTLSFFDPARAALQRLVGPRREDNALRRIRVALGGDTLDAGPRDRVETVLDMVGRAVGSTALSLVDGHGTRRSGAGPIEQDAAALVIPMEDGGSLLVGLKQSGLPYTPRDRRLLRQAAAYIASSLELADVAGQQADALVGLERRQTALRSLENELASTFTEAPRQDQRLDVFALGTLNVERSGAPIRAWGGPKAGTRQAEGIFAFLLDRGERGADKDEIVALIWPDTDLDRADLAFHRTLGGLRRTLAPDGRLPSGEVIAFHNDRYRLNPDLVRWSDIAEFEEQLEAARIAPDPSEADAALEAARRLYRGDYLDDCPFYGDSAEVEERRQLLRGRFTDLLLALAERHEAREDRRSAASYYREALRVNDGECEPAERAMRRMHAPI